MKKPVLNLDDILNAKILLNDFNMKNNTNYTVSDYSYDYIKNKIFDNKNILKKCDIFDDMYFLFDKLNTETICFKYMKPETYSFLFFIIPLYKAIYLKNDFYDSLTNTFKINIDDICLNIIREYLDKPLVNYKVYPNREIINHIL